MFPTTVNLMVTIVNFVREGDVEVPFPHPCFGSLQKSFRQIIINQNCAPCHQNWIKVIASLMLDERTKHGNGSPRFFIEHAFNKRCC